MRLIKALQYIFITILSCSTIYLIFEISRKNDTILELIDKEERCLDLQEVITSQILTTVKISGTRIEPQIQFISSTYDTLELNQIILPNQNYLIYKFNSGDCIECINQQFDLMRGLAQQSNINIVCIYSYYNPREFRSINERFKQFRILGDFQNNWPVKEQSYVFLSANSNWVSLPFMPSISNESLTKRYFEMVTEH